jgi:hypothetical protein
VVLDGEHNEAGDDQDRRRKSPYEPEQIVHERG